MAWRPSPLFVLAPARSYSTVSLALFAGHPDIYGFPEMLVFSAPTVGSLLDERQQQARTRPRWFQGHISGVIRATAELTCGGQSESDIKRARQWLQERSSWTMIQLMNHFLALISPRVGAEKSPETTNSDDALAACLAAYPDARFLHLTRHPVTTQRSMQVAWKRPGAPPDQSLIRRAASAWYYGHQRILTSLARLPDAQWMRIRAEDLLRQPRTWLPPILDWLGVPAGEHVISEMLRTENWRFAGTGTSGRLFGGDPKFFQSPALQAVPAVPPVSFDPAWRLPDQACQRMKALAGELGY
jgi:sulfotransferase family protein